MRKTINQAIGLYELITGGFGALWFGFAIIRSGGVSLIGLVFIALYVLVAWAGASMLRGRPNGVTLSIIGQAAQVLRLSVGGFAYVFLAGLAVWLGIGGEGVSVQTDFATRFHLAWGSSGRPFAMAVNLVPLAIVLYLVYGGRRKKK